MQDAADQILVQLGDRVRAARKERGWPRHKLCERSGISPRYLAQIESGKGNVSVALLSKVAKALEADLRNLLDPEPSLVAQKYQSAPPAVREKIDQMLDVSSGKADRICLLGLRGAGKSTLGARLADLIECPFVELSKEITKVAGLPLSEVMALYGAEGYRSLEAQALDKVTAQYDRVVLAVAGGIVANDRTYRSLLNHFHSIWLQADPKDHMTRVQAQGDMRPMAGNPEAMSQLHEILAQREPLYAQADHHLNTSGLSPTTATERLAKLVSSHLSET